MVSITPGDSPVFLSWYPSGAKHEDSTGRAWDGISYPLPETEGPSSPESPMASRRGEILSPRTIPCSANVALSARGKTLVGELWLGLPGAEKLEEMHTGAFWAMCAPSHPDPGGLGDSERSRGDIALSEGRRRGPPLLRKIFPKSVPLPLGGVSIPLSEVSVWTVNPLPHSNAPECKLP